jgi:proline iminopeptidase
MTPDGSGAADPFAPLSTMTLPVSGGHALYVETIGNPAGTPAVFLHGGPGSGCQPSHRTLFDPARFRAVLFDQRGAGRSTPLGDRSANTTQLQIADIEAVREALGIERWLVVGGSWGATLALAYAEALPGRVTGLALRATFLGTRAELDRAFGPQMGDIYPGLWQDFAGLLPPEERVDVPGNYWRRILDPDPAVHRPAALAWHDAERVLSVAHPQVTRLDLAAVAAASGPMPRSPFMEAHYFSQDCFLTPGQLLSGARNLKGIPGIIVQGELDHLCPPATSAALATVWPDARIEIVPDAGHSLGEPAIAAATKAAIAAFA